LHAHAGFRARILPGEILDFLYEVEKGCVRWAAKRPFARGLRWEKLYWYS